MTTAKLIRLKETLADLHVQLELSFGIRLWDGSCVPSDWPDDALTVVIADPGVLASLMRRPRLDTAVDLWVTGRLDLTGGTLFDLVEKRPKVKLKHLPKGRLLKAMLPFLFAPVGPESARMRRDEGARDGSEASNKKNIQHHYDVSNEFYQLFLDEKMLYSCAYFTDWENSIEQAQHDKLDMICRKLRLKAGETMLDIGCGWGALLCHAAEYYGIIGHGVTLSEEQYAKGIARIAEQGLTDKVTIELKDFSKLEGTFDKISSVGMFEHVGLANHQTYFQTVNRLLKPRGLYLHHAITRPGKATDAAFNRKPTEYKAILKHIFPGAELDHIGMTVRHLESGNFEVHDVEAWREHYALTTKLWAERLMARKEEAIELVGNETYRMWVLYLIGVSIGFTRGSIRIFQTLASKKTRGLSGLPPTRADLYE